jgi:hypothetical protein
VGPILLILSSLVGSTNTVNNLKNKKQKTKNNNKNKTDIFIFTQSHTQHKLKTEHRERVTQKKNSFIRQHKIHTLNSSKNVFLSSLYSSTSLS